jgi:hypothetical protein
MTTQEIKTKGFRTIENIITLNTNVFNGCFSDQAELTIQLKRLDALKSWFEANDLMMDLKYFMNNNTTCQHNKFSSTKIKDMLFN